MQLQQHVSLKGYNTFGINAFAKYFAAFASVDELKELLSLNQQQPLLVLGGGSNVLLTKDFDGLVARNEMRGIRLLREDEDYYYVESAAGENWHQLVMHCVSHGYAGLENLSLDTRKCWRKSNSEHWSLWRGASGCIS